MTLFNAAYNPLPAPPGVTVRDAGEIVPVEQLFYFPNPISAAPDLGPFSDVFRFKLLLTKGGWWIDADVICNSAVFPECRYAWARESAEPAGYVGTSQIRFPAADPTVRRLYEAAASQSSRMTFREGIGPQLLTQVLQQNEAPEGHFGTTPAFYPLAWVEGFKSWLPQFREELAGKTRAALFIACWASQLAYMGIDQNRTPPTGSYMRDVFDRFAPPSRDQRPAYSASEISALALAWIRKNDWSVAELRSLTAPAYLAALGI